MKTITLILLVLSFISGKSQEIDVAYQEIEIHIPGEPGPWLKYKDKYYCYFGRDNDMFSTGYTQYFYVLDKKGRILSEVEVPEELQTFYYDLYIKNDTIFTTEYYENETFWLNENKQKWQKTNKGIDLHYEDKDYVVYCRDFGEWGGVTWFEDKLTKIQYEVGAITPIINKHNNSYYLTESHSIIKIDDPKKLELSNHQYDYKRAVLSERYWREGSYDTRGTEILFEKTDDNYFNPTFSIATSFAINNQLYHLYSDSISTKIGILQENKLIPVYTFTSKLKPFYHNYDTRNRIQNNRYQTVQFTTESKHVYGIIEIDDKRVNVITFNNTYREQVYGEQYINKWVENVFDYYLSNFNKLNLQQIDEIEQKEKARDLTQRHKMTHYLLKEKDIETPRVYRKIENELVSLLTMYYYSTQEKTIELIEFQWTSNRNYDRNMDHVEYLSRLEEVEKEREILYEKRYENLVYFLSEKFGNPNVIKDNGTQIWKINNVVIELSDRATQLIMYKR